MPVLFQGNTGRVAVIPDAVAYGAISLASVSGASGGPLSYGLHKSIITRIGLSAAGNYQFLHTIGNDVYVYVFGDRMGQVVLHGLSFATDCFSGNGVHGFNMMFEWYQGNRIAAQSTPVIVTIGGGKAFQGFITALTGDVQDPVYRTIQFQLTISLLPAALN